MYTNEHAKQHDQKHPWLAVLLSDVFPGAGQIYAGARARGRGMEAVAMSSEYGQGTVIMPPMPAF